MSYGLTQYDVDELIAYSKGACEPGAACKPALQPWCCSHRRSLHLRAPPPACPAHAVTQQEVESLYKRFRALDRGRKVGAGG